MSATEKITSQERYGMVYKLKIFHLHFAYLFGKQSNDPSLLKSSIIRFTAANFIDKNCIKYAASHMDLKHS